MEESTNMRIADEMTGRNRGRYGMWIKPELLNSVLPIFDPGDIIEIERVSKKHWAIYVGSYKLKSGQHDGCVVHLGYETELDLTDNTHEKKESATIMTRPKPKVTASKLVDVAKKSRVWIHNFYDNIWSTTAKNVNEINDRIKQFDEMGVTYDIMKRNCETFALYCRYGEKTSGGQSTLMQCIFAAILTRSVVDNAAASDAAWNELLLVAFFVALLMLIFANYFTLSVFDRLLHWVSNFTFRCQHFVKRIINTSADEPQTSVDGSTNTSTETNENYADEPDQLLPQHAGVSIGLIISSCIIQVAVGLTMLLVRHMATTAICAVGVILPFVLTYTNLLNSVIRDLNHSLTFIIIIVVSSWLAYLCKFSYAFCGGLLALLLIGAVLKLRSMYTSHQPTFIFALIILGCPAIIAVTPAYVFAMIVLTLGLELVTY